MFILGGNFQVLQHEIREMQTTINRLNKDVVDLTQDADENLARRLREDMRELNENWSHIISSTKVHSQHIIVRFIPSISPQYLSDLRLDPSLTFECFDR